MGILVLKIIMAISLATGHKVAIINFIGGSHVAGSVFHGLAAHASAVSTVGTVALYGIIAWTPQFLIHFEDPTRVPFFAWYSTKEMFKSWKVMGVRETIKSNFNFIFNIFNSYLLFFEKKEK